MTIEQIDKLNDFIRGFAFERKAFVPKEDIPFIEEEIINLNPDTISKGEVTEEGAWYYFLHTA